MGAEEAGVRHLTSLIGRVRAKRDSGRVFQSHMLRAEDGSRSASRATRRPVEDPPTGRPVRICAGKNRAFGPTSDHG